LGVAVTVRPPDDSARWELARIWPDGRVVKPIIASKPVVVVEKAAAYHYAK
jgi:hypothetical protein